MFSFELEDPASEKQQPIKEEAEPSSKQALPLEESKPSPKQAPPATLIQTNGMSEGGEVPNKGHKESANGSAENVSFI